MTVRRKICVITGSRAEYGHLFWLMKAIKNDRSLKGQLMVTGMHLSRDFGMTYKIIEADGFMIDRRIPILNADNSAIGITRAVSRGIKRIGQALTELKPDIVVICGDRYESFAAASAAHILGIPIAHLHGGETSQGAIDEAFRHSITKMSAVHFAATEVYRRRIIQLGEAPACVYNFGAPGLDHLAHLKAITFEQLQQSLHVQLCHPWAIATIHPVTLDKGREGQALGTILKALWKSHLTVIFTKANADSGGTKINRALMDFCRRDPKRFILKDNLGSQLYYQCLWHADVMVGNSSSGLTEAPSFSLPVVDIGDRQQGRLMAANIIHVPAKLQAIEQAIQRALSVKFRQGLAKLKNPYAGAGIGRISVAVKDVLKRMDIHPSRLKKIFYDFVG